MKTIDFSKPVTFRIAEKMLEKQVFSQLEISKELNVSVGQVNKVTKFLEFCKAVKKKDKGFSVENPLKLMEQIAFFRKMDSLLLGKTFAGNNFLGLLEEKKNELTACLETALNLHGEKIVSKRKAFYVENKKIVKESIELLKGSGNNFLVCFYLIDIPFKKENFFGENLTPFTRTLIDLACDNTVFIAEKLVEKNWQKKLF